MKKIFIFFLFFLLGKTAYGQDLIVTMDGDSINCKITKIDAEFLYFKYLQNDEIKETLIAADDVNFYESNYYAKNGIPNRVPKKAVKEYPRLRLALNGGYSYRIGRIPDGVTPALRRYLQDLKSGYSFGGDAIYYFKESLGLGFKYGLHRSTFSDENFLIQDENGNTIRGLVKDDISITYFGPSFSFRSLNSTNNSAFITIVSLGYTSYINDAHVINPITFSGETVGMVYDVGYDVAISEKFSLGIQLSYYMGLLTQYDLTTQASKTTVKLQPEEYESLNRIELMVGLRFNQ